MAFSRSRTPYSPCKLYVDGLFALKAGDYLRTTGSAYLVTAIRPSPSRKHRRYLACIRWPVDALPNDATVHQLRWHAKQRKQERRT